MTEGVSAGSVHRLHERLQTDLTHEILVDLGLVVVEVRLVMGVVLSAGPTDPDPGRGGPGCRIFAPASTSIRIACRRRRRLWGSPVACIGLRSRPRFHDDGREKLSKSPETKSMFVTLGRGKERKPMQMSLPETTALRSHCC